MRNFNEWLSKFKISISDFGYYINFNKVYRNVDSIKIELGALSSLVRSKNIEKDFRELFNKLPSVARCIPILLAIRDQIVYVTHHNENYVFNFTKCDVEECVLFMSESGLFDLISNHLTGNIIDYTTGVEVGLDSNGRKNRGGTLMENIVEQHIKNSGFSYFKEMKVKTIEGNWGINLSGIPDNKKFDFVIKTDTTIYGIETNFYGGNGSGSKLNETARSYKLIAEKSKNIKGFKFFWITDGTSWRNAKNDLKATFDILDDIYNLVELESGVLSKVIK
ncbi:MAG: type II restriction endonuclease [Firmicutes bacterium]|nr:type II restriction endonuclease [Bacillota bacterium]